MRIIDNLSEATERFHSDIATESLGLELLKEHRFVEIVGEILVEAGEMEDCVRCSYQARGLKVDGYYYAWEFGVLHLVVSHWIDETELPRARVTNTDINTAFKRCLNFFQRSRKGLHERIEVANEAHELASLIHECREEIHSVRIILITDGIAPKHPADVEEVDGIEITSVIWDVERILQFVETGEREPVTVDFTESNGGPIPCLSQGKTDGKYTTYLAYIPGQCLADLYSQWGTRLLDMNVRVFLSARGKVNRGIRDTILNEPDMFCAYNNGITVFAREVEMQPLAGGLTGLLKATDFQVVNGGQTVASLYHTGKTQKADLSGISVQMKLVVIEDGEEIDILVPKISEYSNTQNRISMADLAANDPPHPELHEISRRLPAPDPTGGSRQTYWFYEKARGSYEETKRMEARTPAQRRAFETLYPKKQRFDKSIFGKAWNTYLRKPHIVSLGAQKNFANFNMWLRELEEDWNEFFKKTAALVMLWKRAELVVRRQHFEGYRHNIVTYTLSWIFEMTDSRIDLDRMWVEQTVNEKLLEAIEGVSRVVNGHIRDTEKNITEWCKKKECWELLKEEHYDLPVGIEETFVPERGRTVGYDPRIRAEVEVIEFCKSKGHQAWFSLATWLKQRSFLTGKARSQCFNMGRALQKNSEPSYALAWACKKAWEDSEVRGWKGEGDEENGARDGR